MRPTTPNFNFAQHAGPSSPPQTPTATQFPYKTYKTRRNGMQNFSRPISTPIDFPISGTTWPGGHTFNTPFFTAPSELSPRSSSPTSSTHSSDRDSSPLPQHSLSSSPVTPTISSSPPVLQTPQRRIIHQGKANFTVEEFNESDYEDFDSDDDEVIQPSQYEDAESRPPTPVKQTHSPVSQLPPHILNGFQKLQCDNDFDEEDDVFLEREAWIEKLRAEKRRKRRSSSSVQKRTITQSIGSDTDEEDLKPLMFEMNDLGSSARRLRRRTGERSSLIFDDPPPRIDELEEPESCEELVDIQEDMEMGLRDLPYYVQEDMDVDTSDEESSDED